MQIFLTRNVNKEIDYVNGMQATVEQYNDETKSLRVMTKTGHRLCVYPWTDREHGDLVYYPIRYGYASTIDKMIGAEFPHITIAADVANRPAAGYTALSRVKDSNSYLIGGEIRWQHFVPATWFHKDPAAN